MMMMMMMMIYFLQPMICLFVSRPAIILHDAKNCQSLDLKEHVKELRRQLDAVP